VKRLREENINTPEEFNKLFEFLNHEHGLTYVDLDRVDKLLYNYSGGKLLDIGCFDSPLCLNAYIKYGDECTALDFSPVVINRLKRLYPQVNYVQGDAREMKFKHDTFDYVVVGEIIEHMESPEEFLDEVFRVLKPGGILALSTPESECVTNKAVSHQHLWSFEKEDIKQLLSKYGDVSVEILKTKSFPVIIGYCQKYDNTKDTIIV